MAKSRRVKTDLEVYLKQIDESPLLTAEEEKYLARKIINEGCMESREHMIRSNLRLVVAVAKRYMNRGLPLQDLIEEGNVGLMKAVEGFNPDMGARFSTYGCWWIKQGIKRALINAVQPIHIPAYMVELIAKWKRASRDLEDKLGRQPTIQELAKEMDLPAKKVRIIRKAVKASQRPVQPGTGEDGARANALGDGQRRTQPPAGRTSAFGRRPGNHQRTARRDRRPGGEDPPAALRPRRQRAAHPERDRHPRGPHPRTASARSRSKPSRSLISGLESDRPLARDPREKRCGFSSVGLNGMPGGT